MARFRLFGSRTRETDSADEAINQAELGEAVLVERDDRGSFDVYRVERGDGGKTWTKIVDGTQHQE